MKKSFFLLVILIACAMSFPAFTAANMNTDLYDEESCILPDFTDEDLSGYTVYNGKVYYFFCTLDGADPLTIEPLDIDGRTSVTYAQDKNRVYFMATIMDNLKPDQFKIKSIEGGGVVLYGNNAIYFDGSEITDIHPDIETLKAVGDGYYKDKDNLYLQKIAGKTKRGDNYYTFEKVEEGSAENFETGYNITPDAVYWYGKKIEEADVGSFELLHFGFAKDKNNVFFEGKIVYGADVASFVETPVGDVNYYVDKNGFFGDDNGQHYLTIPYMNREYPKDAKITQNSLSSAISTYESKYPSYTPQPTQPAPGSPEEAELKKFQEEVVKAQQEEVKEGKQNMIRGGVELAGILLLGGVGYGVIRRRKKQK